MRGVGFLGELIIAIVPFLMVGMAALPFVLVGMGLFRGFTHEKGFSDPFAWVAIVAGVIIGIFAVPDYIRTVEACKSLEAAARTQTISEMILGMPATSEAERLALLERGCQNLVIKW